MNIIMPEIRKHAAIMFTDIVGYTRLMGTDEEKAVDMLSRNRSIHQSSIEKFNGTLIKELGDGILASFSLASEAVRCGIEIQKECKEQGIPIKIGIHEGEMIFSGSDVIGDGVNIASRLQEDAQEGCISISASVYSNIRNKPDIQTTLIGERIYKNVGERIKVYKVIWDGEKGEQHNEIAKVKNPKSRLPYVILTGIILVLAAILITWKLQPHLEKVELDKSIAILPLEYLSEDPGKQYLADGVLDAITGHLSKIKGLRVTPRTSIEQYRETTKTASIIGKELDVSYLIEGSFLMVEDQVMLTIQLVSAKDEDHVFFKEYKRDYKDIIAVQSEVAQTIAKEIEVIITPSEKDLIEKTPTENLTAYDLYLKAKAEPDIAKSLILYNLVLDFDSTFALAYAGLAQCYREKHFWDTYFKEDFLDSSLILANIALSYDNQLEEGYRIKGKYFQDKGKFDEALKNFEKAVDINPNAANIWYDMGVLYGSKQDYLNAMICMRNAYNIDISEYQFQVLTMMSMGSSHLGLFEESRDYLRRLFELETGSEGEIDSLKYNVSMLLVEYQYTFSDSLLSLLELAVNKYPDDLNYLHYLGYEYMFHGDFEHAYYYIKKHKELVEERGQFELVRTHRLGYVAWELGKYEEAEEYFKTQMYHCKESIRLKRPYGLRDAYFDLAGIYAFKGQKDLAYESLDKFASSNFYPIWLINLINNDPMFNNIRDEPRFQRIIDIMKLKNRKERERVEIWMAEHNSL